MSASFLPQVAGAGQGVGARLPRKEDDRLMRGRGQFVADIRLAGLQDVAFVRSPLAHALIRGIHVPEHYRGSVFTAADLAGINPIRAVSGLPGFKISEQPVLATGKVRQVGELVAMCVAPTRAEAEDIAAAVTLDLEELPAVYDMLKAREPGSALVHEHWGDNVFLETNFEVDISSGAGCADQGDARDIDRAAVHVAARRTRRGRDLRSPPRSAHALFRRPRCRTSCAAASPNASAWSRAAFASSRPTSAAASGTRAFCCRKRSAFPG